MPFSSNVDVWSRAWQHMERAVNRKGQGVTGVPSGFRRLDVETSGWQYGDLIVLAARPGVGKSTLALHMAFKAAKLGFAVVFVPLEMTAEACSMRVIASAGRLDERALRTGQAITEDYQKAAQVIATMGPAGPLWLEERQLTVEKLRALVLEHRQTGKCDVVFVDQLGNVKPANTRESRTERIGSIADELKEMARDLRVAVVACHQMSREQEHSADREPMLWHLKDSGRVEENADVVILLHRDWNPGQKDKTTQQRMEDGVIKANIAKNRHGMVATCELMYHARETRFEEMPG